MKEKVTKIEAGQFYANYGGRKKFLMANIGKTLVPKGPRVFIFFFEKYFFGSGRSFDLEMRETDFCHNKLYSDNKQPPPPQQRTGVVVWGG